MTKLKLLCISGPRSIRRATGPFFFFLESAFVTRSMYVATRLDLDHCRAVPCDRFLFSTSFSFPRRNGAARVCQPSQDDISFLSLDCTCLSALPSRIHVGRAAEAEPSYFLFSTTVIR